MFTGIVEQMGEVVETEANGHGRRMVIHASDLGQVPVGASLSVNGVCLTVVEKGDDTVRLDVIPETLQRSSLGSVGQGDLVNLEPAMPGTGRFDGHIVQGHVDGTGRVAEISQDERGWMMSISAEASLLRHVVEKGSITVDGVSLTVASVDEGGFKVALIPHTLERTTLGLRRVGDLVNLETDVLAKYVERLLEERG